MWLKTDFSADREHQGIFPVTGEENTIILGVIAEIIAGERDYA